MLYDQILLNDGNGNYLKPIKSFLMKNIKYVQAQFHYSDIDGDGDYDLSCERLKINNYGLPASGYILVNDGKGNFINKTSVLAPDLENIGMITDSNFQISIMMEILI